MKNKPNKPDDRRDNVSRIQDNIDDTIKNCRLTNEAISETDDPKIERDLTEKNKRREKALDSMRKEIQDEAMDKRNEYK